MATRYRILAWEIPRTEEPGGLHPWGHKESAMTERLTTQPHTEETSFFQKVYIPDKTPEQIY